MFAIPRKDPPLSEHEKAQQAEQELALEDLDQVAGGARRKTAADYAADMEHNKKLAMNSYDPRSVP